VVLYRGSSSPFNAFLECQGTNQNIILTPSGTGIVSSNANMRAFDARYDRDIKEVTDEGEIIYIYKPSYDTKHTKRQRVPNSMYKGEDYV